jgi:hypothetical protein
MIQDKNLFLIFGMIAASLAISMVIGGITAIRELTTLGMRNLRKVIEVYRRLREHRKHAN